MSTQHNTKNGVSLQCYKGDAMTLLAFDYENPADGFVGFTVLVKADGRTYYLNNRLSFKKHILEKNNIDQRKRLSTLYSPLQKYRWVHVPSSEHYADNPFFGAYTYIVSARHIKDGLLLPIDPNLTVEVTIDLSPFEKGCLKLGFTRAFISSQAYAYHFGNNSKLRPNREVLTFDTKVISGKTPRWDKAQQAYVNTDYTYEEQFEYLGWQVRDRIKEFLKEVIDNPDLTLEVFAYDLNEPYIIDTFLMLAGQGRIRIILDNYPNHIEPDCYEEKFDALFRSKMMAPSAIYRGKYNSQSHSKIFIQKSLSENTAVKVLTGSTNFTTNGLYVNANHVLVFNHKEVAGLYSEVFNASISKNLMAKFKHTELAMNDHVFNQEKLPDMTIRFAPHTEAITTTFFDLISDRIANAKSDVLFAIMIDNSRSSILDAVIKQVESDHVFTYGITDETEGVLLYTPNSKRGVKVTGLGTETDLPKPFSDVAKIPGHNIHHKFVVVDFKGKDPVVYCGSSNLAFNPEQNNGDNLIEIRDSDIVTAFAIEAIRLIDHYHWRNKRNKAIADKEANLIEKGNALSFTVNAAIADALIDDNEELTLRDGSEDTTWFSSYYNINDLHYIERTLLIS